MADDKAMLRAAARERRARISAAERVHAARMLAELDLTQVLPAPGAVVAGYCALGGELDPLPLLVRLTAAGFALCLPAVVAARQPLQFRAWLPGDALVAGTFGIGEPRADAPARTPDMLLVPLLAFDRRGHRLGYGGGYYDRTIAALRRQAHAQPRGEVVTIGVAFEAQEVDAVPHLDYDETLDWVLTPAGPIDCRAGS